jgi:NAD(P)-dependent dehydrogenase (short-subunit alcohol dehydrogenase family)
MTIVEQQGTPESENPSIKSAALIIGASRGIGLAFVEQLLAGNDYDQVFATHRHPQAPLLALTAVPNPDPRLTCLPLDLTDEANIVELFKHLQTQLHPQTRLTLVINCVGWLHTESLQPEKSLRHLNVAQLERYFLVNSIGPALLAKHLLPLMKHPQPSVFATISAKVGSIGDNASGGWYGYRASKAALNMLVRTAAIEYKRSCPQAIVVVLHPGTTDTDLSQPFQRNVPTDKLFTTERTTCQLLQVIAQLKPSDSGEFFSWDGSRLPW